MGLFALADSGLAIDIVAAAVVVVVMGGSSMGSEEIGGRVRSGVVVSIFCLHITSKSREISFLGNVIMRTDNNVSKRH